MPVQDQRRIGLLAIHGIGEQAVGETKADVVAALLQAYPEARESDGVVDLEDCQIRVYEVWWSSVLSGPAVDGSFDIRAVQQLVWFPLLNRLYIPTYKDSYTGWLVWSWTLFLIPFGVLLTAAYYGLIALSAFFAGARQAITEEGRKRRKHADSTVQSALAEARERTGNRILDQVGADVINYVNAAAGAEPAPVPDAEKQIYECVETALLQSVKDGCTEIQVLAHSLGSLIAYRALTVQHARLAKLIQLPYAGAARDLPPLTGFYTVGSPLEKIRFFWPKLLLADASVADPNARLRWHNFKGRWDVVAGLVTREAALSQKIENHWVKGAGGLLHAHTAYLRTPRFQCLFGELLTGKPPAPVRSRWRPLDAAGRMLENAAVPALLLLLALVGIISMLITGGVAGFAVELSLRAIHVTAAGFVGKVITWSVPTVLLVLSVPLGFSDARPMHAKYWRFDSTRRMSMAVSPNSARQAPKRIWHFLGSIALLVAIAWFGLRVQPRENAWLIILALMTGFALLNGQGITGARWGIFIDARNKISLSRLQMLAWTLLVLSALLASILSNVALGSDSPMDIQIPSQLWVLLGLSTATAVGAPALLNAKRSNQADDRELEKTTRELKNQGHNGPDLDESSIVLRNLSIRDARWSELLKGDESGNASTVDLGKLQMFFFTFILVFGYGAAIYAMLARRGAITGLPPVQDGMNVLLGISQTGYLASKAMTVSRVATEEKPGTPPEAPPPTGEQQLAALRQEAGK